MKKPIVLAPVAHTRTMQPNADTERLLASGSWVQVVKPKKRDAYAKAMDRWRERRKKAGYRQIYIFVPGPVYEAVCAAKREGETFAELLTRLVGYVPDESKTETHD